MIAIIRPLNQIFHWMNMSEISSVLIVMSYLKTYLTL